MKLINCIFYAATICFSTVSVAQSAEVASPSAQSAKTSDLATRLLNERNGLKKIIESERGATLSQAADIITGSGLSDPELYAAVEQKTKVLLAEHKADPKNDAVETELSDLIRALGSMNPNAKDLIASLVEGSTSSGVRNRAHRLIPKLYWFQQRNIVMQKTAHYEPGQDLMTHRYINLILSEDSSFGRWALEELNRRGGAADPIVYKKMAEVLQTQKSNITGDTHLDYLAWICKTLRRFDAANSAELLNSISSDPSSDKYTKKLKKYAKI